MLPADILWTPRIPPCAGILLSVRNCWEPSVCQTMRLRKNAGAEVVSDIIFLQKRDRPLDIVPEWTQTGQTEDGFAINRYFIDHPEMVLGRQEPVSTAHGMDYTVNPIEGLELSDQLHDAVKYIRGTYQEAELPELGEGEAIDTSLPADSNVKNYSYAIVDGAGVLPGKQPDGAPGPQLPPPKPV